MDMDAKVRVTFALSTEDQTFPFGLVLTEIGKSVHAALRRLIAAAERP
jgi:hypothetical protein